MVASRRADSDTPRASESGRLTPVSSSPSIAKSAPVAFKDPGLSYDLVISALASTLLFGSLALMTAVSFTFDLHEKGVMLNVAFIWAFLPLMDQIPIVKRICGTMACGATYTCWNCMLLLYTVLDRLILGRPPLLLPCLVVNSWAIVASFNVVRLFDSDLFKRAADWTGYGLLAFHAFNFAFHTLPAIVATVWFVSHPLGACGLGSSAVFGTILFHFCYAMRTAQSIFLDKVYFECPKWEWGIAWSTALFVHLALGREVAGQCATADWW